MKILKRLLATAGVLLALFAPAALHAAGPVSQLQIKVPHRTSPQFEISALKITLLLDTSDPITLSIGGGSSGTRATQSMNLNSAANDCFAGSVCFTDFDAVPAPAKQADSLVIVKPLQVGFDPATVGNNKVTLFLQLSSNIDESNPLCSSTMNADETWTITVTSNVPTANRIAGVAVQSLDRKAGGACPSTQFRTIPPDDGPVATTIAPAPEFTSGRVGLDAVLVLDRSGSMSALDGTATDRLTKLKTATNQFLSMWKSLRDSESTAQIQSPTDHVGIVFFDQGTLWTTGVTSNHIVEFNAAALSGLTSGVTAVPIGGSTSIGNGLIAATDTSGLPSAAGTTNRRIIMLMTDGAQNTEAMASADGTSIVTTRTDPVTHAIVQTTLPKQPFQLFTVTVGNAFGPDAPINQALATATGAYTLNTTHPAAELDAFFLQTLQNAHKFSTVETMRVIQDVTKAAAPFKTQFPVTSTTTRLAFSLSWPPGRLNVLRARLTPPGGGTPIDFTPSPGLATFMTQSLRLPLQGGVNAAGLWTLEIITDNVESTAGVAFNFVLMGDDSTINSSLGIVGGEHSVGQDIKITAQVNDFGRALKGLGLQSGAIVKAFVVKPGNNVGDVLSDRAAQPVPPTPTDTSTPAERKLAAILAEDPNALKQIPGEVILHDDGAAGDDKAGDGIYTAVVPAEFEGHYNVVFLIEGVSASGGRFVRQQIRTVHVRSMPDPATTQVATQVTSGAAGSILNVVVTPRNRREGKLGPAWANYIWGRLPNGAPVRFTDRLDGTYLAQVPFSGSTPPPVSVHFLPEPVVRPDDFVPAPGDLTAGNQIVGDVTHHGFGGAGNRMAVWLALGSTFPHGSFRNAHDGGFAGNIGFEYGLNANAAIEATLGYHEFKGTNGAPEIDVTQYGVGAKWYFAAPWRPFLTAGIGGYSFDPGSSRFGGWVGAGVQVPIDAHWSIEGRYNYHMISGNSPNSQYSTLQIGVRYGF